MTSRELATPLRARRDDPMKTPDSKPAKRRHAATTPPPTRPTPPPPRPPTYGEVLPLAVSMTKALRVAARRDAERRKRELRALGELRRRLHAACVAAEDAAAEGDVVGRRGGSARSALLLRAAWVTGDDGDDGDAGGGSDDFRFLRRARAYRLAKLATTTTTTTPSAPPARGGAMKPPASEPSRSATRAKDVARAVDDAPDAFVAAELLLEVVGVGDGDDAAAPRVPRVVPLPEETLREYVAGAVRVIAAAASRERDDRERAARATGGRRAAGAANAAGGAASATALARDVAGALLNASLALRERRDGGGDDATFVAAASVPIAIAIDAIVRDARASFAAELLTAAASTIEARFKDAFEPVPIRAGVAVVAPATPRLSRAIESPIEEALVACDRLESSGVAFAVAERVVARFGRVFLTLVPVRPRRRGERRSLRTFSPGGASLRPPLEFNPDTPRCLSFPLLTPLNSTPTFARMDPRPSSAASDAPPPHARRPTPRPATSRPRRRR